MIPTSKVIDLITAFKNGDQKTIDQVMKSVISIAEKRGQVKLAQQLRKLYSVPSIKTENNNSSFYTQGIVNLNESLYEKRDSKVTIDDIILSQKNKDIFSEIVLSYKKREFLTKQGIASENKILLYGAPGTGKTLFAYVLAGVLGIPVLHVHLDALISSYLGDTGKNIRHVFEEAKKEECVLFIDEFDSIAKKRDDHHELGELKRVVTVLLQNIDEFPHNSLLVTATNHDHLLDDAIWRRFDYQLNLDILDMDSLKELFKLYLKDDKKFDIDLMAFIGQGRSGALIKQAVHRALRRKILNNNLANENVLIFEELLKISDLKNLDLKDETSKKLLKDVLEELRKYDKKYYTYKKLEEITGIPDASLNYYLK